MITSIWRYSHLSLAVSSFLFIVIAAVTGVILAFEPISQEAFAFNKTVDISKVSVSETIQQLKNNYDEVYSVTVNKSNLVSTSVLTLDGEMEEFYINPITAKKIGNLQEESTVFNFARALHRSLFLKTTGRYFVAFTSFILFLISITGLILVIKRQQGIKKFFSKIVNENFYQFSHVYLGRLSLIPILMITLTGVYLSFFHLDVLSHVKLSHQIDYEKVVETPTLNLVDFPIFKNTPLSQVKSIEFPFSEDVEDYYQLNLEDKELLINQYTGKILSELKYPFNELFYNWSWNLHTGEGSWMWSVVLLLSSISILFFIYSGFKITLKRKKSKIKNKYKLKDCNYLILVGSETGSTITFATWVYQQIINANKKVYIAQMNHFKYHDNIEHIMVFTATYGVGEAPANAIKFKNIFNAENIQYPFSYSIVGFGSFAYPDFCKYAYEVENLLEQHKMSRCLMHLHTVNNKSVEAFNQWIIQWSQVSNIPVKTLENNVEVSKKKKKENYEVVLKTELTPKHHHFLVALKKNKHRFKSGDLLAISPDSKNHDRLYSVGVTKENNILLSVKLHQKGLCSNYLNNLLLGDVVKASRLKNKEFQFPKKAKNVVMIATGTGIAPFLGMMENNITKIPLTLYWGAKDKTALEPYATYIDNNINKGQLNTFIPAYSREGKEKIYVQNLLNIDEEFIMNTFKNKGVIMICGSVAMQKEVLNLLNEICLKGDNKTLSYYQQKKQLRMDCY
ncbi:PepSY domain-containing protein [Wenyingzhuangia sp. IMCC45467]